MDGLDDDQLAALASTFQGELLEGLELLDFDEFTAWCAAEREHARTTHGAILAALIERHRRRPSLALPHARELVRIDPLDQGARADLIELLLAAGRRNEALAQYESATRLLEELGAKPTEPLSSAGRAVKHHRGELSSANDDPGSSVSVVSEDRPSLVPRDGVVVGRKDERARLLRVLDRAGAKQGVRVFLLKGESGVGKTTLLSQLANEAKARGCTLFEGAAYEAEAGRPYGPWVDALRKLPEEAIPAEQRKALAPLLPELGEEGDEEQSRDRLFGAIVETIAARARPHAPALLMFDDIHWCDDATAELLHYVARVTRDHSVAIVLGARDGELVDNESVMRVLRSLRREGLIEEQLLLPLTERDITALVHRLGSEADAARIFEQSGGNPLLARELAHAAPAEGPLPSSLKELIGDRLARLPAGTGGVLRWAAILGPTFDVERLSELVSLELDPLMGALSVLERHALLESQDTGYQFHHALVHRVVYTEISEPRRKLMHLRVARLLEGRPDPNGEVAMEVAHHAGVGGDVALAARACVVAGGRCLKLFANAEAYAHARRGLRYAESLPDPERLKLRIELEHISTSAKIPDDVEGEAKRIEALAEEALAAGCPEHARLGFTVVSYLRWTIGEPEHAHRLSLRAEFASRGAGDRHRMVGMAEAARCLVMLERDVPQAEALLHEARALTERSGDSPWPVLDGLGLLHLHAGDLDAAKAQFEKALDKAKKTGNRVQEFMALEHLVMVSIETQSIDAACEHARDLATIGEKLREGSERPLGRAMLALCRYRKGEADCRDALESGLQELREVDAKQRLSFVLLQAASVELSRGELDSAERRAREALSLAEAIEHPSSRSLARALLVRIARERGDIENARRHVASLEASDALSDRVRREVMREIEALRLQSDRPKEKV